MKLATQLLAAPIVALFMASVVAPTSLMAKPRTVPAGVSLQGLEGGSMKSRKLRSDKVVVQFFASWCGGCGTVMSELGPMIKEMDGVLFVPVSVDESMADAKDFFKHQNAVVKAFKKQAFLDSETALVTGLKIESLPALVVLERGRVILQVSGHPSESQYAKLKAALAH